MKMFFLLKNNARRGMGGKGVLKKGEEKGQKKASKIREFYIGWPVGRKVANFEGWGSSV